MLINNPYCFLLVLALCGVSAQEYGERLTRQSSKQSNGYFYPEPSPPFTLPPPKLDYLPPPRFVECIQPQTCQTLQDCSQIHGGQPSPSLSNGDCLISGSVNNQAGVCCNPAPTTTTQATTTLSLDYLPPTTSGYKYPVPENPLQYPDSNKEQPTIVAPPPQQKVPVVDEDEIPFWDFRESIPGEPETDYPILDKIPKTTFSCDGRIDGYYADTDTRCQVFHICNNIPDLPPTQFSFLCPNGTIFDQQVFACIWWPDVNCAASSQFFDLNKTIGKISPSLGTSIKSSSKSTSVAASARGVSQVGSRPSLSISASVSV